MPRSSARHRGTVLLAALGLAFILGIVTRGMFKFHPTLQAQHSQTQRAALEAALSGMEYAKSRLSQNPSWKAEGVNQLVVDTPSLAVLEDRGNVLGLISLADGGKARFCLRFNNHDGAGGPDGLDDSSLLIPMKEISYNNILSDASVTVPEADSISYTVSSSDIRQGWPLPGRAVALAVMGEAGVGVSGLTLSTINEPARGFSRQRTIQTVLTARLDIPSGDAVIMAGGGIDMTVAQGQEVQLEADDGAPRLRTKKGLQVQSSDGAGLSGIGALRLDGTTSHLSLDESYGMSANVVGPHQPKMSSESVGDGVDFYNLPWNKVRKADSSANSSESVQLPGGVYVLANKDEVHYYDMSIEEFSSFRDANGQPALPSQPPSQVITSTNFSEVRTAQNLANNPDGLEFVAKTIYFSPPDSASEPAQRDPAPGGRFVAEEPAELSTGGDEGALSITKDLYITSSSSGQRDFAIVTPDLSTEAFDPYGRHSYVGNDAPSQLAVLVHIENATVSCEGNMLLRSGNLHLSGATLTGAGALTFQTMKLDGSAGESNLSVYFQGDVDISSWNGQQYGHLALHGTLYSHGQVKVQAGDPDVPSQRWGEFQLDGNIVSYGGDPSQGSPGSSGGLFSLVAKSAALRFSSSSVAGLFEIKEGLPESVTLSPVSFFTN